MIDAPRIHVLSATTFDTTTDLTTEWGPKADPNQPRLYATQTTVGRMSFGAMLRPGVAAAVMMARLWEASNPITMRLRSAMSAELDALPLPDDPSPVIADSLLTTVTLSTLWSTPTLVGPTDALTLEGERNTLEFMLIELGGLSTSAYLNAVLSIADDVGCCTTDTITVDSAGLIDAWGVKTRVIYVTAAAGSTIIYPDITDLEVGQRAIFVRTVQGPVYLSPSAGDAQNGVADGIVEIDGFQAVTVERQTTTWIADKALGSAAQTIANAVSGAVVAIADPDAVSVPVRLNFTAPGFARLPAYLNAAFNDEFVIQRNTGTSQIILIPQVGETVNGEVNGQFFMTANGAVRAKRSFSGWNLVSDAGSRVCQSLSLGADATLALWGADDLIVLATQAAAQTITLPLSTDPIRIGARAFFGCAGAGGLTINGNGANIRSGTGAPAATMVLAQHENAILQWTGAVWIAVLGT